ncbi:MAG: B12-binding domain-containing radical SAM protein [Nitrospirota bacterium]|nr:B12-binding domain-containing radical SAM protein [Nitrospirota bacterium]
MNLAYLASYLRRDGFSVSLVDFEVEAYSDRKLLDLVEKTRPLIIGISSVTPTIINTGRICEMVKTSHPSITTVVGGPHVNGLPAETLREFPFIDIAAFGEGEETFAEICRNVAAGKRVDGIKGTVHRSGDQIVRQAARPLIEDIDTLPFPARDLISYAEQAGHSSRGFSNKALSTELFTSRGCPFPCTFCAIRATFGETVRFRSPASIREEVSQFMEQYHFGHVIIADDTFTLRPDRTLEICEILAGANVPSWSCDTRVTHVSRKLLQAMKQSGCRKVAFGVESGSPQVLERIRKRITIEQVREAVQLASEAGIEHVEGNFIIGSDPDETSADIALTRELIMTLPWTFVSVSIIVPYPGTPVRSLMESRGLIDPSATWEDYEMFGTIPRWRTAHFDAAELLRLQKALTRSFYLRPSYIARQIASVRSWSDVRYWLQAGMTYARWHLQGRLR